MKKICALIMLAVLSAAHSVRAFDDHSISGEILQKLESGILIIGLLDGDGRVSRTPEKGTFYVRNYPESSNLYDGRKVTVRVSDDTIFSYTDVQGARRTVRAFVFSSFTPGGDGSASDH